VIISTKSLAQDKLEYKARTHSEAKMITKNDLIKMLAV